MFNKLTAFAEKYGMKQDGKMHYYGMMQGYETNLMCNSLADSAHLMVFKCIFLAI